MEDIFLTLVALIIPFAGIIFGLVEFFKAVFDLQGKTVTVVSFCIGIFFGVIAFLAYLFPEWGPYLAGVVFVLSVGLVASGFYKFADARWPKNEDR